MYFPRLAVPRIAAAAATLALLLFAAGCASKGDRPHSSRGGHARPFASISGQEPFFHGMITAEVLVGAMTGFAPGEPGAGSGGRRHPSGNMHVGAGNMPPGMRREGGMGGPPGGSGAGEPDNAGSQELRRADAMGSAPVMIHLRFTNHGTEKAELVVADFLSPLGNFVVHPDTFTLEPGQSLEVDPMTSRLAGDVTGGEVSLTLKLGQERETKIVALALAPAAEPPAQHSTSNAQR